VHGRSRRRSRPAHARRVPPRCRSARRCGRRRSAGRSPRRRAWTVCSRWLTGQAGRVATAARPAVRPPRRRAACPETSWTAPPP